MTMHLKTTLYTHATIITIDAEQTIWLDGAILVQGNRIKAIGKTTTLIQDPDLPLDTETVSCQGRIIIPGLVNTHAHLGQSLLRGLAEDVPLHSWLCDTVWPLEASYESDDGYVAACVTIAEMLKSGTTCFLEALLTPTSGFENAARAVDEMGIRACLVGQDQWVVILSHINVDLAQGRLVKVETTIKTDAIIDPRDSQISNMSIGAALQSHKKFHETCEGRLHVWMAAVTPRGSNEASHKAIGDACAQHDIGLTMHCAEAPKDLTIYRESYDCSPVEFCQRANLIGKGRRTVLAHMVNLDLDRDLPLLHETGVTVAHNPSSNCKLASGIAATPRMLAEGVNVGLGTDGAPCANTYDMIQEMRMASLIQKGSLRDAKAMTAEQVLTMATINGAKALGLDKDIGSLGIGKKADFVIIDPSGLHCVPFSAEQVLAGGIDPITTVVFSCTGADVDKVVVDGVLLVDEHQLVHCDETQIKERALESIRRIRKKSGLGTQLQRNYC